MKFNPPLRSPCHAHSSLTLAFTISSPSTNPYPSPGATTDTPPHQRRDVLAASLVQRLQLHGQVQHAAAVLGQPARDLRGLGVAAVHGLAEALQVRERDGRAVFFWEGFVW